MSIPTRTLWLALAFGAAIALTGGAAYAHSFRVALILPGSDVEARQILDGFLFAAAERDGHPDETADGHLGGLDVYVEVLNGTEDAVPGDIQIVATLSEAASKSPLEARFPDAVSLTQGVNPFTDTSATGVAGFIARFRETHGEAPTAAAAIGYNAARRIDLAVRAEGGAEDQIALRQSFAATANGLDW